MVVLTADVFQLFIKSPRNSPPRTAQEPSAMICCTQPLLSFSFFFAPKSLFSFGTQVTRTLLWKVCITNVITCGILFFFLQLDQAAALVRGTPFSLVPFLRSFVLRAKTPKNETRTWAVSDVLACFFSACKAWASVYAHEISKKLRFTFYGALRDCFGLWDHA